MTKPPIVFFGNERLVSGLPETNAPLLRDLIEQGYPIAAVVSHHSNGGNSRNSRPLEVAVIAQEHNIPVLLPNSPMEVYEELQSYGAEIGILSAYGRIVPQAIIDLFPKGIINLHPSLLPRHRGSTPIESAILDGDTVTGVSIMKLAKQMDAGPVYAQSELPLGSTETKQELYASLSRRGAALLIESLPKILDGSLVAVPQDDSQATYDKLIQKSDGIIDWNKSAERIEREIRAYQWWPQSRTKLGTADVIITKAHAIPSSNGEPGHIEIIDNLVLMVDAAEGYLCIDALKPLGKKEMPVKAFLQGYRAQL